MNINETRKTLIDSLFEIVGSRVKKNDFYAARLYQRDLILLMMQDRRFSKAQVSGAYFALAEFCAKVHDYRGVNKYTNRASKYKRMASQGDVTGLGKLIQDRNKSLKEPAESVVTESGQRFLQSAFRSI